MDDNVYSIIDAHFEVFNALEAHVGTDGERFVSVEDGEQRGIIVATLRSASSVKPIRVRIRIEEI
jgi:hypothetical protein